MRDDAAAVLVGVVASRRRWRTSAIAQAPQTAFASLSAPARLILLAEQTRDVEHGRSRPCFALLRRYIVGARG